MSMTLIRVPRKISSIVKEQVSCVLKVIFKETRI